MNRKCNSGFFAIEVLAALIITAPCLLALAVFISRSATFYRQLSVKERATFSTLRVHELFQDLSQDIDRHLFAILPRIHKDKIQFNDGSVNLESPNAEKAKLIGSDAITYFRLDTLACQAITSRSLEGDTFNFKACDRYGNYFSEDKYKSFLLVSSNGLFETLGSSKTAESSNKDKCRDYQLKATKSMITPKASTNEWLFARHIIPIESIYTLYVDKQGRLRYLGHRGIENIENQPVLENIESFKIEDMSDAIFWKANIKLQIKNFPKILELSLENHLGRLSILNFLLNT